MYSKARAVIPIALLLLVAGCATKSYTVHPGAANLFDSQAYDTLYVAHATIEQTKTELTTNQFGATTNAVKTALNALIDAYNIADASYVVYHSAAVSGKQTAAQTTTLQNNLVNVTNSMNGLTAVKGGS